MRRKSLLLGIILMMVVSFTLSGCSTLRPKITPEIELPFPPLQFFTTPTRTPTITATSTATYTPHPPYPQPQGPYLEPYQPEVLPTEPFEDPSHFTPTPTKTASPIPPPSLTPTATSTTLPAPNQATLAAGEALPFQVLETGTNNDVYKGKEPKVKVTSWASGSGIYLIIAVFRGWQPYLELGIEVNKVTRVEDVIIIDATYTKSQTGIYSAQIAEPFQVIAISTEGLSGSYQFLLVHQGRILAETTFVVE